MAASTGFNPGTSNGDTERQHRSGRWSRQWCRFMASIRPGYLLPACQRRCHGFRDARHLPGCFRRRCDHRGLPYGAATNVQQAFENMYQCPPRSAREWGDLVRRASPHRGPWPRISVWHGGADATVIPPNATEIIKQWMDVHGLPARPSVETTIDGYPRQVWRNAAGDEVIESYTIPGMAHGTPLATGNADNQCGAAGPFLLEVGISSSYHICEVFWSCGHPQGSGILAEISPGLLAEAILGRRAASAG